MKFLLAEKVRADSKNDVALTSVADLLSLAPEMEQDGVAAVLDEMRTDERYADIKPVTSPIGEVYYHSDKHMSGYYAIVLSRVAAKDPVRHRGRHGSGRIQDLPASDLYRVFHGADVRDSPRRPESGFRRDGA